VAATVAATLLQQWLAGGGVRPFFFFYLAVLAVAPLCGIGPGLLTTALSLVVVAARLPPSVASLEANAPGFLLFALVGAVVSVFAGRERALRRSLLRLEREVQREQVQRRLAESQAPLRLAPDGERLSRVQLKSVIDLVDQSVMVLDAGGKVVLANQAAATTLGFLRTQDLGRNVAELNDEFEVSDLDGKLLAPEDRPSAAALRGEVVTDRVVKRKRRGDGRTQYFAISGAPLRGEGGEQVLTLLVTKDVTAQYEAVKAREETENAFHAIFDHAALGMAEVDARTGRFLRANRALCEILGYSAAELSERTWGELTHPDDRAADLAAAAAAMAACVPFQREKRYLRKDGSEVWCQLSVSPQWAKGEQPTTNVLVIEDVTRKRALLRAERESAERLSAVLQLAPSGYIVVRVGDRVIIDANEAWPRLLGFTREEVLGQSTSSLGIYRIPEEYERIFEESQATGALKLREVHLRRRSGEPGVFLMSAAPATVGGERVFIGALHDITELRTAAQAREESEERYRTLFNLAPSGVVLMDEQGRFLAFNDLACALLGRSREEFAVMSVADLDGPDATPAERALQGQRMARVLAGETVEFETNHRRRDGSLRDLLIRARLIRLGGEPRVLAVWHDVTERKRADAKLRQSGERFRALIEKATDMTILLGRDLRTSFWSPSATAQLGWTTEELGRRGLTELVHGDDRLAFEAALAEASRTPGATTTLRLRAQHRDGTFRHLTGSCRNLLDDAAVSALVVNARDDTAERSLSQQLLQSQKLESVGRLAGGVAHDFNNLLTVIMSCAEQLESDLRERGTVVLDDVIEVQQAGARAGDLTRQLLAFARRQATNPVPLSLDGVVQGSEKLLRRVLGEDIALVVRTAAQWPIFADRGQIDQILVNLAVNARDAMPDGGTLTIETATVDEREEGTGHWVLLRVTDTGMGMTPEVQAQIFEPFFTTKEPGKGTGLGLATVHGIVAQSEGRILVASAPGRGTTFELRFPRTLLAPAAASPPTPVSLRGTETVLLVEDDAQVRGVTAKALERAGYTVLAASSGDEALALAAAHRGRLDLVICDVVMGGMNGRVAVDRLREAQPGLRALFISGYTHEIISQRGVLASGVEFLPKPFTPNVLLARLREVLAAR
jgi:PAS domain S-box-containing protein